MSQGRRHMSVWWSVLWEFNGAIYHMNNDPEADAKIERLKEKFGAFCSAEEVCRGTCEKYGINPAAGTCVTTLSASSSDSVAPKQEPKRSLFDWVPRQHPSKYDDGPDLSRHLHCHVARPNVSADVITS